MSPNVETHTLLQRLDSDRYEDRLDALRQLCCLKNTEGPLVVPVEPQLPSYDHVHTRVSYGHAVPSVVSVSQMVWAAFQAKSPFLSIIEHESLGHVDEAIEAVDIVNAHAADPLMLALGVEFRAPVDARRMPGAEADRLRAGLKALWNQDEAAWVVGMGAEANPPLRQLVQRFQQAKRTRTAAQIELLNKHLQIEPPVTLADALTPEGNVTDRGLSWTLAKAKYGFAPDSTLTQKAREIRKLFNPGQPGYCPFPEDLLSYVEVIRCLSEWGMLPSFTAQLRGDAWKNVMTPLYRWGIRGLDTAGVEPNEPDAEAHIQQIIRLAEEHDLALFGGSDYRGLGSGWSTFQPWMAHRRIVDSQRQIAYQSHHLSWTSEFCQPT